jgi:regulator of RNase E activity RraA
MKRGAAGVVTDGGFRDSPDIARLDFPVYHQRPSAPTNITRHHAVDIDVPIACGDAAVYPGDVIVGDKEGVLVVPAGIAEEVAAEAAEMTVFEDFVIEQVANGRSIFGLYPATDLAEPALAHSLRLSRNGDLTRPLSRWAGESAQALHSKFRDEPG